MATNAPAVNLALMEPWRVGMALSKPLSVGAASELRFVISYPGLAPNQWATYRLRQFLASRGHAVMDWGQGLNVGPRGDLDDWLKPLREALVSAANKRGPVHRVGWSLGGIYARELAKLESEHVAQVVTLGTPFAGVGATNVAPLFWALN